MTREAKVAGGFSRLLTRISGGFDRLPIRTRLASVSALLTFVILCAFAIAIGSFTVHRIRSDFNRQVSDTANQLTSQLDIKVAAANSGRAITISPSLSAWAAPEDHAVVRIFTLGGSVIAQEPSSAPSLGAPSAQPKTVHGYRVMSVVGIVRVANGSEPIGQVIIQYGRKVSDTETTVAKVELFLLVGVLAGTALALLAGMAIARRAMKPIAELTSAADGDRTHARPLAEGAAAARRRRGRRAGADARGDASRARCGTRGERVDARAPAALRRRRLTRAAHAADQRARQPRAAG